MTEENIPAEMASETPPRWSPLGMIDRRVLGVLAEKAKTTPDAYPMSVSAICTGCNQKSNRAPVMNLQSEDVEESLERLRELGAAAMVQGLGRVTKYKHYLYEWLGVEKVELAVMTELLLRGPQTEGELRGRAARMDPIADLNALRPVLASLKAKGLVLPLTPEGRGHVVTHALYQPQELAQLRAQYGHERVSPAPTSAPIRTDLGQRTDLPTTDVPLGSAAGALPAPSGIAPELIQSIRRDLDLLRTEVQQLRSDMDGLLTQQRQVDEELRSLREALGG